MDVELVYAPRPEYGLVSPALELVDGGVTARGGADVATAQTQNGAQMARDREAGRPPVVCRRLPEGAEGVALTFDDCDDGAAWDLILDVLAREAVRAAFFGLGMRVEQFPTPARRTVAECHFVGAHGWDHRDLTGLRHEDVVWRLEADRTAWRRVGAADVVAFRPPFGRYDASTLAAAQRAGYRQMVLWDVDPRDWQLPGAQVIATRAAAECSAGSVIDLHVTAQTAEALPDLIAGLRRRGLPCLPLTPVALVPGGCAAFRESSSGGSSTRANTLGAPHTSR